MNSIEEENNMYFRRIESNSRQPLRLWERFGTLFVAVATLHHPTCGAVFTWEPMASTQNWDAAINWAGALGQFPDNDADLAIVSGVNANYPQLIQDRVIGGLTITGGGQVRTGSGPISGNFLGITDTGGQSGALTIHGSGSRLTVFNQAGWDLDVDYLNTSDGGVLDLGSAVDVVVDREMNNEGIIQGNGLLHLQGGNVSLNDGDITSLGYLRIDSSGGARIDLDGSAGDGRLIATSGSRLIIQAELEDPLFNGDIILSRGGEIQIDNPWTLHPNGDSMLWFRAVGGGNQSTLTGAAAFLDSRVLISPQVDALFAAPVNFGPNAHVDVDLSASVQFDHPATVSNPDHFVLSHNSQLIVNNQVSIGTGSGMFDWDGTGGIADTTINPGGHLNINVGQIDFLHDWYQATTTIHSGELTVRLANNEWDMKTELRMNNVNGVDPTLRGDRMILSGDLYVEGTGFSRVESSVVFGGTSHTSVAADALLVLAGTTTRLEGGTWSGAGSVFFDSEVIRIANPTTIAMPEGTVDLDGFVISGSWHLDAPLHLNVYSIEQGDPFVEDLQINPNGRLNMQTVLPEEFIMDGNLELNGAGPGLSSLHFQGNGVSIYGNTTVTGNSSHQSRLRLGGLVNLVGNSVLNLQGGSRTDPNVVYDTATISGDGDLQIAAAAQLEVQTGATINVPLLNDGRFEPGLDGIGSVVLNGNYVQSANATLAIELGAAPGPGNDWLQVLGLAALQGDLEVATLGSFVPSPGDVYTIAAVGSRVSSFDSLRFELPNALTIDADLQYTDNAVFLSINDVAVSGDFDGNLGLDCEDVNALVAAIAAGDMLVEFDLNGDAAVDVDDLNQWLADAGELNIGAAYLPGDANLDGVVDVSDFGIWNNHKFTDSEGWCQGDFNADGVTDVSDFGIWNSHKFSQSGIAMVPEPEGMALSGFGLILLAGIRRRK